MTKITKAGQITANTKKAIQLFLSLGQPNPSNSMAQAEQNNSPNPSQAKV
jgi:hypothetical protein